MTAPLCIDLFSGLGGFTEGFLAEGYRCVGFDIERHRYPAREERESEVGTKVGGITFNGYGEPGYKAVAFNGTAEKRLGPLTGGWVEYPAQLVLQDVLTLHGSQFKDAAILVASPPCQTYSYLAMPWSRSTSEHSQAAKALRRKWESEGPDNRLFDACFRIQREACEAAGRYIPLIVENVRGAQEWVGPAKANYGSFYLWGDVDMVGNRIVIGGASFAAPMMLAPARVDKVPSLFDGRRPDVGHGARFTSRDCGIEGTKIGGDWFSDPNSTCRKHGSRSNARKAASAQIAKIPLPLSQFFARAFKPKSREAAA
jgi:hypothetical protein